MPRGTPPQLSPSVVDELVSKYKAGESIYRLALCYDISDGYVTTLLRRRCVRIRTKYDAKPESPRFLPTPEEIKTACEMFRARDIMPRPSAKPINLLESMREEVL